MSGSADFEELAKFDRLAEKWWDPEGEFKALHDINPYRLAYIQEHVDLNGQRVLDVGCGGGILTVALAKSDARCTGIDLAPDTIKAAQLHATTIGLEIDYRVEDVLNLAERVESGQEDSLRRGYLLGDARACSGTSKHCGSAGQVSAPRRLGVSFHHQSQS